MPTPSAERDMISRRIRDALRIETPTHDKDFTPELARKTLELYRGLLAEAAVALAGPPVN